MSFDELKKNIQDKSVPDRQILKMFLGFKESSESEVFDVIKLLYELRPAVIDIFRQGSQYK